MCVCVCRCTLVMHPHESMWIKPGIKQYPIRKGLVCHGAMFGRPFIGSALFATSQVWNSICSHERISWAQGEHGHPASEDGVTLSHCHEGGTQWLSSFKRPPKNQRKFLHSMENVGHLQGNVHSLQFPEASVSIAYFIVLLALPTEAKTLCLDSLQSIVAWGILAPR